MSEATIEYKNSPNESTAYAVSEGQKTKVQLVATPAGDLELADNPNVDTGYIVIDGKKHKCELVAEVAGELKLPTSATADTGYVTTQDGRQHKVRLVANVTGGGGEPVEKTKFGATIDNFLGDVDANGIYVAPSEPIEINLVGVRVVNGWAFSDRFYGTRVPVKIIANDATLFNVGSFSSVLSSATAPVEFEANAVEEMNSFCDRAFEYAFYTNKLVAVKFRKLKKISAQNAFSNAFGKKTINADETFPSLEDISGTNVFGGLAIEANQIITFSKVKKITGHESSQYSSTFGSFYVSNTVWNFPSATEFTGYIWNGGASYAGEIHFAAANQAAIEACDGYANKWGFAGATIYFDL